MSTNVSIDFLAFIQQTNSELFDKLMTFIKSSPEILADFLTAANKFIEKQCGPVQVPESPNVPEGMIDISNINEDGSNYVLRTKMLSEDQIQAINKGDAEGQIQEKAGEFLKAFMFFLSVSGTI